MVWKSRAGRISAFVLVGLTILQSASFVGFEIALEAKADSVTVMGATLPTGRTDTSAIWSGQNASIFGGSVAGGKTANIVSYDPAGDIASTTGSLPTARAFTSAIWNGQDAYVFGGIDTAVGHIGQIVRFNPTSGTLTVMTATLPSGRAYTSAVWDGHHAFVVGGQNTGNSYSDQIVRYNTTTDVATTVGTLPTARAYTSSIWDGQHVYIFGGHDGTYLDKIVRFNISSGIATNMTATLPTARAHTSAIWDGLNAYIFGGETSGGGQVGEIIRYNPATDTVTTAFKSFPSARAHTSAVWDGQAARIFGGGNFLTEIVRYDPLPGAPTSVIATAGPGAGKITLTWQSPPANTVGSAILNYTIYRGNASGTEILYVRLGNVTSYEDVGLSNNATFFYRITATDVEGESALGNETSATTFSVPSFPRNLSAARGPSPGQISLLWQPPANNGGLSNTNYTVYRGNASGTQTFLATIGNVTNYSDVDLASNTTYFYKVTASTSAGEGPPSNESNATTFAVPSPPQNLAATGGLGQISLTWQAPISNGGLSITNYTLYRGPSSGNVTFYKNLSNVTSYTDSPLPSNTLFFYRVTATSAVGEGPASNAAGAFTFAEPRGPQNLTATPSGRRVLLAWQPPSSDGGSNVTNYRIYRGTSPANGSLLAVLGNATSYTDTQIGDPGLTYFYSVAAVNAVGQGANSTQANATVEGQVLLNTGNIPIGPGTAAVFEGRNETGNQYCLYLTTNTTGEVQLACVNTFGVPIPETGRIPISPSANVSLKIRYYYDSSRVVTVASAINGLFVVKAPLAPTQADAQWLAANATWLDAQVLLSTTTDLEAIPPLNELVSIPGLGQVLGAAHESRAAGQPLI